MALPNPGGLVRPKHQGPAQQPLQHLQHQQQQQQHQLANLGKNFASTEAILGSNGLGVLPGGYHITSAPHIFSKVRDPLFLYTFGNSPTHTHAVFVPRARFLAGRHLSRESQRQCDQPASLRCRFFPKTATQKGQKHPSFSPRCFFSLKRFSKATKDIYLFNKEHLGVEKRHSAFWKVGSP